MVTVSMVRRRERGMTLIETMVVIGIALALLAVFGMRLNLSVAKGAQTDAALTAVLDRAHLVAQTSGVGATIVFTAVGSATSGYDALQVCPGRPTSAGLTMSLCREAGTSPSPLSLCYTGTTGACEVLAGSSFFVAMNPDGSVTGGATGNYATAPVCAQGQDLVLTWVGPGVNGQGGTQKIDCATGLRMP